MKKIPFVLLLFCLGVSQAEDFTLSKGVVLKNATVIKSDPSFLTISHDDGITRVPLAELPEAVQKKYSYDQEKDKEHAAKEASALWENNRHQQLQRAMDAYDKVAPKVEVQVIQAVRNGALCNVLHIEQPKAGAITRVAPGMIEIEKDDPKPDFLQGGQKIYILGLKGVLDEGFWSGRLWYCGYYTYESVGNGVIKVRMFATSREAGLNQIAESKLLGPHLEK